MRQRHYRARVWLNENEYGQFIKNVEKAGLSKETYLRKLIIGKKINVAPSQCYRLMMDELVIISKLIDDLIGNMENCNSKNEKTITRLIERLCCFVLYFQRTYG